MTTKVQLESVDDGTNVTESFKVTATVLVDAGYLAVQRGEEVDPDATLPEFKNGEILAIDNANVSVRLVQKKTQPERFAELRTSKSFLIDDSAASAIPGCGCCIQR